MGDAHFGYSLSSLNTKYIDRPEQRVSTDTTFSRWGIRKVLASQAFHHLAKRRWKRFATYWNYNCMQRTAEHYRRRFRMILNETNSCCCMGNCSLPDTGTSRVLSFPLWRTRAVSSVVQFVWLSQESNPDKYSHRPQNLACARFCIVRYTNSTQCPQTKHGGFLTVV